MTDFKTGDKVIFATNVNKVISTWRPAMERAKTEPVRVVKVYNSTVEIFVPFKEAPMPYATIFKTSLELCQEPVNASELEKLL